MDRLGLTRRVGCFAALMTVTALVTGCNNQAQIEAQIKPSISNPGGKALEITKLQDIKGEIGPGVTTMEGQKIEIDCTITLTYQIGDQPPVTKTFSVGLHTGPLPKGTMFHLKCDDPLIFELPTDASQFKAMAAPVTAGGRSLAVRVRAGLKSISIGPHQTLKAEAGTQLVSITVPRAISPGVYEVGLMFSLKKAKAIEEKVLAAALAQCGPSAFDVPLVPRATSMTGVPAVAIPVSQTLLPVTPPKISQPAKISIKLPCGK